MTQQELCKLLTPKTFEDIDGRHERCEVCDSDLWTCHFCAGRVLEKREQEIAALRKAVSDRTIECGRLEEQVRGLKVRIHRANTLLHKAECWLVELNRTGIGSREPGWISYLQRYDAYRQEIAQNHDWWQWDEESLRAREGLDDPGQGR